MCLALILSRGLVLVPSRVLALALVLPTALLQAVLHPRCAKHRAPCWPKARPGPKGIGVTPSL